MAFKLAAMRGAAAKLRKHVPANVAVPVPVRISAAYTHIFPVGEYFAGGWTALNGAEKGMHHRTVSDILRIIDGSRECHRKSRLGTAFKYAAMRRFSGAMALCRLGID